MYFVDKTTTPPKVTKKRGRKAVYPFAEMDIDDSFCVEKEKESNLRAASYLAGKRLGFVFTVSKMPDGTVRCWRIG